MIESFVFISTAIVGCTAACGCIFWGASKHLSMKQNNKKKNNLMTPIKNYFLNMWNMWNLVRRIINIQKDNKTIASKTDLLPLEECALSEEETDRERAEFKLMADRCGIYDYESAFHKLRDICFDESYGCVVTNKSHASILFFFEWSDALLQKNKQQNIRKLSMSVNRQIQDSKHTEKNIQ